MCLSLLLSVFYNFHLYSIFFLFQISLLYWKVPPPTFSFPNIISYFRCFYSFLFIFISFICDFEFIRLIQSYLHKIFFKLANRDFCVLNTNSILILSIVCISDKLHVIEFVNRHTSLQIRSVNKFQSALWRQIKN